MTAAIRARGLRVSFGGIAALAGVDLDVAPRARLGVIGPNGAGKTTLLDTVCGFVRADAGSVLVDGADVSGLTADARARRGLARSFQDARLFPSMTVHEALLVAATPAGRGLGHVAGILGLPSVRRAERAARATAGRLLDQLGLAGYRDVFIGELSTGMRRLVDLAGVLAREPKVVLLDEPSAGLAQAEVAELAPLLLRVAEASQATLLIVEHDIPLICAVAEELVAMESGRVVARGAPAEVLADPAVIESYLGTDQRTIARSGRPGR